MEVTKIEPPPIGVCACDETPIVRLGLERLVSETHCLRWLGHAPSPETLPKALNERQPDVCVLEVMYRQASGLDLIRTLAARFPSVDLIVFSLADERAYAERCLGAGARGYVSKTEPLEQLVAAIHRVRSGEAVLGRAVGLDRVTRMRGDPTDLPPTHSLSPNELEVLGMIGQGMTTGQIAATLKRSIKTVETYRARIKAKLRLKNGVELTLWAGRIAPTIASGSATALVQRQPSPAIGNLA